MPAPWADSGSAASLRALVTSTLRRSVASSSGRACASTAAAPATAAAAALVPLTVPKRVGSSGSTLGSVVAMLTPGATTSGLTRPS